MSLTLRAVSLNDQPLSRPLAACFGHEGGTVGRADYSTLALPDPERHISRQQAQVGSTPTGFVITNIGSANPIAVAGQTLAHGQSAPLRHGDQVRIGGYLLEVIEIETAAPPDPAALGPAPAGEGIFDDLSLGTAPRSLDAAVGPRNGRDPLRDVEAGLGEPAREAPAGLWEAFCEGAGVALMLPQGPTLTLMRAAGALLRNAVEGTLELMSVRATTKQALHADQTLIQTRHHNPLRFSPDTQSALEQLLLPPLRGFLDGPAAMKDAMEDLVGHAIGNMAGTRAAFDGVLDHFAPQALEHKLSARTMLESLVPMSRKARLWELYLQHFEAIRGEAQEDFDTLFSRAFLAAYEQQLRRLRQARPG